MTEADLDPTPLSEREREVLALAAEGLTDKEIAVRLGIGVKTIRTYWDRMRQKLGAASRTQVLAEAHRLVQEELASSEERLQLFVQSMPVLFFAMDKKLRLLSINQECANVSGYDLETLREEGKLLDLLFPKPAQRKKLLGAWAAKRDFRDLEADLTCPDGTTRTVLWSSRSRAYPIPDWPNWAIGYDISPRKEFERSLRESEGNYRRLLETSEEGIWLLNKHSITTYANARLAEMLRCKPEEIVGRSASEFQDEVAQALSRQLIRRNRAGAMRTTMNFRFRRADGTDFEALVAMHPTYSHAGELTGHCAMLTDMTEAFQQGRSLLLSQKHYSAILEHSGDCIFRLDRSMRCLYSNFKARNGECLVDLSPEELSTHLELDGIWAEKVAEVFERDLPVKFEVDSFLDWAKPSVTLLPEQSLADQVETVLALVSAHPPRRVSRSS